MEQTRFIARCWQKETALWKPDAHHQEVIRNSLGWLHVAEKMEDHLDALSEFAEEARRAGFRRVVQSFIWGWEAVVWLRWSFSKPIYRKQEDSR